MNRRNGRNEKGETTKQGEKYIYNIKYKPLR